MKQPTDDENRTATVKGIARYDAVIASTPVLPAWAGEGASRHFVPDLELLGDILTIPISEGATSRSGLLGKGVDTWFAHEFRRAGFEPERVWPRAEDPRVLPREVAQLLDAVPHDMSTELRRRLTRMRSVAPQNATILGRAYTKQVDVVISSWQTGPELLLSTKTMSSSFGNNLANRFEEAYGDAGNLRARYPLAAIGFAFVVSSAILDEPSQAEKAVDMLYKLRDRGDGNGYTSTTLIAYHAVEAPKVKILTDAFPDDLGPTHFMEKMISTILGASSVTDHQRARESRRGYFVVPHEPDGSPERRTLPL